MSERSGPGKRTTVKTGRPSTGQGKEFPKQGGARPCRRMSFIPETPTPVVKASGTEVDMCGECKKGNKGMRNPIIYGRNECPANWNAAPRHC